MGPQAADVLEVALNGATLASEPLARDYANNNAPYTGQHITFTLASEAQLGSGRCFGPRPITSPRCGCIVGVRPSKGPNTLSFALASRPDDITGGCIVRDVELVVEYSALYRSRL